MRNPIKDLVKSLVKKMAKKIMSEAQQLLPDKSLLDKVKKNKMKEKLNEALDECKNKAEEQLDKAIADGTEFVESYKSDLNIFGIEIGSLAVCTAQFASRIALIPPAMIVTTPTGPGISPQLAAPMLQDLKAEGDLLSKIFDDSFQRRNKLRLDALSATVPGLDEILTIHDTVAATAKPLILMVGAACDGAEGILPEITPPLIFDYKAENCINYTPIKEGDEENPTANNCSKFEELTPGDGRGCNNCKRYKE